MVQSQYNDKDKWRDGLENGHLDHMLIIEDKNEVLHGHGPDEGQPDVWKKAITCIKDSTHLKKTVTLLFHSWKARAWK